ncbi:MAG: hypothetical protein QM750_27215 [Rubrivivax sp.]
MADRNDGALQAAIKALEQAVAPAVDPADPLAAEQLRLVVGYLKLLRGRLGRIERRARFELQHHAAMAQSLHDEFVAVGGESARRAQAALAQAAPLLADPAADPEAVRSAAASLAGAVSGLVRAAAAAEPALRRRIEHAVAQQTRRWVDAQRAWFAPLGFELHAAELPALDDALAALG